MSPLLEANKVFEVDLGNLSDEHVEEHEDLVSLSVLVADNDVCILLWLGGVAWIIAINSLT